jgi:adenine-specific DNA-methyltransferase
MPNCLAARPASGASAGSSLGCPYYDDQLRGGRDAVSGLNSGGKRSRGPTGRLELTWANKDRRLLAHGDVTYEWVDPVDWRVSEVHLLDVTGTYGEHPDDNLLIQGDALHALTALTSVPEYAERYLGKVKLVYIDPPFNTGQTFQQYDDNLEHSVWLTMLRDRLEQVQRLLMPQGSVWLHCDDSEQHRARCVMDEVFGANAFVATVLWQKRYSRDNRPAIGQVHDFIHVYSPLGLAWKHHRNRLPPGEKSNKQYRMDSGDGRGPWRGIPMDVQAGHATASQFYEVTTPAGVTHSPAPGRAWSVSEERMRELIREGRVYFGKDGRGKPNLIRYLSEHTGLVPWTWWPSEEVGHNDEAKKEILRLFPETEAFETPKPERLLERVVHVGSDVGDLVLDCFAGSGTAAAVAHKMGRRWLAVELSAETVDAFVRPRLCKVVDGEDPGGITDAVSWAGGGGFTEARVAPSMFEDVDGTVVLSDWVTNGQLAEAVAAQLKFTVEPDGPFVGRKGRTRLAVLDGMLTMGVADLLLEQLDERENLVVVAMSLEEGVAEHLRMQRPGSRARKVPRDLARSGKLAPRLVRLGQAGQQGKGG